MRRNDIQGLRAIAVLIVLLFHAFPSFAPGGYIGVDVFFVVSGYLITGIIYRQALENRFSFVGFYRRRVRRIFPALFAMLFATVLASWFILSPREFDDLAKSSMSAIFSISNIYFFRTSGYFATEAELKTLLHTWSLGVEEQFYILLPVAMILILRLGKKFLVHFLVIFSLGSLAISELALKISADAAYFLLPTRGFELLIGSILAVSQFRLRDDSILLRNVVFTTGLVMILTPTFAFSPSTPFPGINALYPAVGSALILLAGSANTPVVASKLISSSGFRFFGDISYSLYLWHWPILALLRVTYGGHLPLPVTIGALLAAVFMAYLSYRFVEQPFLHHRDSKTPVLRLGTLAMVLSALVLLPVMYTKGFPGRFSPETLSLFQAADDYNPKRTECHNGAGVAIPYKENCVFGMMNDTNLVAVWGDSHGAELAYALGEQSESLGMNVMQITASNCPPALDFVPSQRPHCVNHNRATLDGIVADQRVGTVVLTASGHHLERGAGFLTGFVSVVRALIASGKNVVLVEQLPIFDSDPPMTLGYANHREADLTGFGAPLSEYQQTASAWNLELRRISERYSLSLMSVEQDLCWDGFCPMYSEVYGVLYFNRTHVSLAGAKLLANKMMEIISAP